LKKLPDINEGPHHGFVMWKVIIDKSLKKLF
jgi:hypothetical protein